MVSIAPVLQSFPLNTAVHKHQYPSSVKPVWQVALFLQRLCKQAFWERGKHRLVYFLKSTLRSVKTPKAVIKAGSACVHTSFKIDTLYWTKASVNLLDKELEISLLRRGSCYLTPVKKNTGVLEIESGSAGNFFPSVQSRRDCRRPLRRRETRDGFEKDGHTCQ